MEHRNGWHKQKSLTSVSEHAEASRSPENDNEDPRDREIQQLTAEIKRWHKVYRCNHEEIHFIPPVSFGELDHDTLSRPSARHRFKAEPRKNGVLRNRIKFHEFCGMSVKQMRKPELIVEFNSSHHGNYLPESYCMALQTNDQGVFSVKRAYLPPSINLKDALKHVPFNNGDNLKEFLRYIQQCVSAYLFRTADLENLKKVIVDSCIKSVQVSGSLNSLCVFMELPLINITNKATVRISTVLEYEPDSFLPTDFTIDSDIDKNAKKEAESLLVRFIKLPLSEAYTILVIKNILSSDESSDTIIASTGNSIVGDEDIEQPREAAKRKTSEMVSASSSSYERDQNTLITKQGNKNNKRLNKSVGNKPKTLKFTCKRKSVEIDQEEEYKSVDNEKEVNKLVNKKHKTDQNFSAQIHSEDDQSREPNKAAKKKKKTDQKTSARIQSEEFDPSEDDQSREPNKAAEKKKRTDQKTSARIQSEEFDPSEDESEDDQSREHNKAAEKKKRTDQKTSARIQSEEFDPSEDESEDDQSREHNKAAEKEKRTDQKTSARIQSEEFDPSEDESEDDQSREPIKAAKKKKKTDQKTSARIQSEEFDPSEDESEDDDQSREHNKAAEKEKRTDQKTSARIQSEEFDPSEEDESEDDQSREHNKAAEKEKRTDQKTSARIQSEEFDPSEDESEDDQSREHNKAAEKEKRTDQKTSARIQSEEFDPSEEDESEDDQIMESNKSAEKKLIVSGKGQSKMLKGKERESIGPKEKESKNVFENKLTEESDLDSVATDDLIRWTKRNLAQAVSESNFSPTMLGHKGRKDEMKSTLKSTRETSKVKGKTLRGKRGKGVDKKQATIKMFFNK